MGKVHNLGHEEGSLVSNVFAKNESKNMVVFDIGVNRGLYIDLVKDKINTIVHGFEPIEHLFKTLEEKYSSYENVILNQIPLSDSVKDTYFFEILDEIMDGCSSLIERPVFSQRQLDYTKNSVTTTSVDIYCDNNNVEYIDLMKIDVEGAEVQVLKGCEKMFKENRIGVIQFECGDTIKDAGNSLNELSNFISQFGYYIHQFDGGIINKLNDSQIESLSKINDNINLIIKKND